MKQIVKE